MTQMLTTGTQFPQENNMPYGKKTKKKKKKGMKKGKGKY